MTRPTVEQITAAFNRDQLRANRPLAVDELPLSFESITNEWLTNALCANAPGAEVVGFSLGERDTGSSNRRRIALRYNAAGEAAGLPKGVFCKASQDLANRTVLGISSGARSEVIFYRDIRGALNIEAPQCHFAKDDPETFNSMIILGDITDEVTEFCDHTTEMSRARAESQMRLLGELHGRVYGSPQLQRLIGQFPTWPQFFDNSIQFGLEQASSNGFLAAEEVIPARLYARYEAIWPTTMKSVALHNGVPQTLQHGDVHLKNWYVAGNGEMGLSDWQCCGRGIWARDVAYTISSALQPEDRRQWEKELLALYLEHLREAGGPALSFDSALLGYRQQLVTALTWWTVTLTPPAALPDMQPRDTTLEFIRRIATAVDDHESLDAF